MSGPKTYEIRADFDRETLVVYQAFRKEIGLPAIEAQKFVTPFSFTRMTWIKPSYLWLMDRSNWGQKSDQAMILAIRIRRQAWESALREAVLTHPEKKIYGSNEAWRERFEKARIIVQWDPERSLRGAKLEYSAIQVGISRHLIEDYATKWITEIQDYTPLTRKIHAFCRDGEYDKAKKLLPPERVYPVPEEIAKRLGMA